MRKTGPWRDTRPTEPKPRRRKGGKPAPAPWETDPPGGVKPRTRPKRRDRRETETDADA